MQVWAKRRLLTINHAIQSHLKSPLFLRALDKPRSKGVKTQNQPVLKDAQLPLLTDAFKGTVLEEGGIARTVVSGQRLNWLLHCFWERDRGYNNILRILDKELDVLSRKGEGQV